MTTHVDGGIRRLARGARRIVSAVRRLAGPGRPLSVEAPDLTELERRQAELAEAMQSMVGPAAWCVDTAVLDADWLEVRGWAMPVEGRVERVAIHVDGVESDVMHTGLPREDVAHFYWFWPAANRSGFHCRHRVDPTSTAPIRISYVDRESGRVIEPWHCHYVDRDELRGARPLPSLEQVLRTHAGNSLNQYQVEGYSTFVKLEEALRLRTQRSFADCESVLDFGCGCGRVSRYFDPRAGARLIGADVDRACIAWCAANLPGDFRRNALQPPLDLAEGSVACVIAIDVFMHFREADGVAWLNELARVCQDGAVLLISIASDRALARARLSAEHYARIRDRDFIDLSANQDLLGVIDDPSYYRNVFHSHRYIRERWSTCGFRVIDILPGVVVNQHDVVMIERRPR